MPTTHQLQTGPPRYTGESKSITTLFKQPGHPARDRARGTHGFLWIAPDKPFAGRPPTGEPYLSGIEQPVIITAWDRSEELAAEAARTITLADGDLVTIDGYTFRFNLPANRWTESTFTLIGDQS